MIVTLTMKKVMSIMNDVNSFKSKDFKPENKGFVLHLIKRLKLKEEEVNNLTIDNKLVKTENELLQKEKEKLIIELDFLLTDLKDR